MLKKLLQNEVVLFLFLGGIAAATNFTSRILLNHYMSFRLAVIIAYIIGMVVAFILFRKYVFGAGGRHSAHEFRDFTLVNLVGIILVWLISVGLAEYLFPTVGFTFFAHEIAHGFAICVPAFTSYFGHKYFSFRKS